MYVPVIYNGIYLLIITFTAVLFKDFDRIYICTYIYNLFYCAKIYIQHKISHFNYF